MTARFEIGLKFTPLGKNRQECEIIDILKTYNSKNELTQIRYVTEHSFLGQKIKNYDVCDATIARATL